MEDDALLVLVDGSNVARSAEWRRARPDLEQLDEQAEALVDAVASWASREGCDVVLALDGVAGERTLGRTVVVGCAGTSADDVLERYASEAARRSQRTRLVTSDRELSSVAGASAEWVQSAGDFVIELVQRPGPAEPAEAEETLPGTRLGEALSPSVREQLERMRRGEQ